MHTIERRILEQLNGVLRVELTAVEQHFIHVLTLKAWDDRATADGITAIDMVDLPNAMRIVDLIVAGGAVPDLGDSADRMPTPGASHQQILAAEQALEARILDQLRHAETSLRGDAASDAARLIRDAVRLIEKRRGPAHREPAS